MKITVISDTHISRKGQELPSLVLKSIENSDLLIHAGDFTSASLLYYLEALTRVEAVAGNNDGADLFHLGKKKIIELNGYSIGITHGEGDYSNILQRVKRTFSDDKVDIVIFGHSHQPYSVTESGVLYFNPGSPTNRRRSPKHSYGEITLGKKIGADIIYF
ncbi:MAG: metallophosphoesterase family protein [Vulcanibacillus sp.]